MIHLGKVGASYFHVEPNVLASTFPRPLANTVWPALAPCPMALAQAVLIPDDIDAETDIAKVELRHMLDESLAELLRGEGIEMDDAAWEQLLGELRARRPSR